MHLLPTLQKHSGGGTVDLVKYPSPVYQCHDNQYSITTPAVSELMGHFEPAQHPDFVPVPEKYTSRPGMYLRRQTYQAFCAMSEAAWKDSIRLVIISATRNFDYQKGLWEAKWTGKTLVGGKKLNTTLPQPVDRARMILNYTSMPGSSRHHWGTDMDLNFLTDASFSSGKGYSAYQWLKKNASTYGYCQVYGPKGNYRTKGYNEEKWHWSYLPLAKTYLQIMKDSMHNAMITGFAGSETAVQLSIKENYVLSIDSLCH